MATAKDFDNRVPITIGLMLATPHSIEAMVKPAIENRNICLRPTRVASQPDSGVMIAAATM